MAYEKYCCVNQNCPMYGKRGASNIALRTRFGKNNESLLLYCTQCKNPFAIHPRPSASQDEKSSEEMNVSKAAQVLSDSPASRTSKTKCRASSKACKA